MNSTSQTALKEWAVIVRALRDGRQSFLLRKGGIADERGTFQLKEKEFFLYPTFEHQTAALLNDDGRAELALSLRERPAGWQVLLDTYAEVTETRHVTSEKELTPLLAETIWSEAYLQQRLTYKPEKPLLLVTLRVHKLAHPHMIDETPAMAGCKSWVPLESALATK